MDLGINNLNTRSPGASILSLAREDVKILTDSSLYFFSKESITANLK